MTSVFPRQDWSKVPPRRALSPTEIVTRLTELPGWRLDGDGADIAIEKSFAFANYHETMAFVNAVAFIAHAQDHHPDLSVHYARCVVRFNTHDAGGLTATDFDCAKRVEQLLA